MSKEIKMKDEQISQFLMLLEGYGVDPDLDDDEYSSMFSDLLMEIVRSLDKEQSKLMFDNI